MPEKTEISRRAVIATAALVPVAAIRAAGATSAPPVFSEPQRKILDAFIDRLIPSDEHGPGALECGAGNYINEALAGPLASEKAALLEGLSATDAFAQQKYGTGFAELSAEQRDEVLTAIDNNSATGFRPNSRAFFDRLRRLTLEGTFSDPYYGGNKQFAGWDMIRYPGPRLAVAPEDQEIKVAVKPVHRSAYGANHGH